MSKIEEIKEKIKKLREEEQILYKAINLFESRCQEREKYFERLLDIRCTKRELYNELRFLNEMQKRLGK